MPRITASIAIFVPIAVAVAVAVPTGAPDAVSAIRAPAVRAAPTEPEEKAVRRTLGYYLEGHATGDPEVMRQAFHTEAMLYWIQNGQLQELTLAAYLARFSGEPAEDEAERRRRIASVDVQGTAASARIELDYPGAFIVDYMSLLEIDGEWKIVNKIFHVERTGDM